MGAKLYIIFDIRSSFGDFMQIGGEILAIHEYICKEGLLYAFVLFLWEKTM